MHNGIRKNPMAIVAARAGQMQPSNHFLDQYVAHKISSLTECGAPELPMESSWLSAFILNSVLKVSLSASPRAYVFNFIRRAEGAFSAYREARQALIEYIDTPRHVVSPYFRSLLNFEVCISQCWQGYELLRKATGAKLFEPKDNSTMERLNKLYNDSKHMEERIDQAEIPTEATASVWITNQGLESARAPLGVSFADLVGILTSMGQLAEKLSRLEPTDPNPDAPPT
jgi:hypothetical protein